MLANARVQTPCDVGRNFLFASKLPPTGVGREIELLPHIAKKLERPERAHSHPQRQQRAPGFPGNEGRDHGRRYLWIVQHPLILAGRVNHRRQHQCRQQAAQRSLDWNVWFSFQNVDVQISASHSPQYFSTNDYSLLTHMALDEQGGALGWDHLIGHLLEQGKLVSPVAEQLDLKDAVQYLLIDEKKADDPACGRLKEC